MLAFTRRASTTTALTLAVALTMSLSVPAFSDPASSKTEMPSPTTASLQRGDLVRLRSGGPLMTVGSIKGNQVECFWTDLNGEPNADNFPVDVLQKF